ncbi:MAG TPA: cytochrome c oxidase assembly protein [Micromonosporaceae bacterium]|nr:cytochrome c oxidase assembly protein [Micromonosporaceae bacterium]
MTFALTALVGYLLAAARLIRTGRRWRSSRAAAFLLGTALLGVAACPALTRLAATDFRAHVAVHLLLGGFAPLALALGRPMTLALATMPRAERRYAVRALRSRAGRTVAHPWVAAALAVGPLYPLYLTPFFATVERTPVLHTVAHVHFLLAGYLLAAVTIGIDTGRPASLRVRVSALVLAFAGHATLAKLLYVAGSVPGYPTEQVTAGAELMYYGGDVAELLLVAAVFTRWYVRRRRTDVRVDQSIGLPPVTPSTSPVM